METGLYSFAHSTPLTVTAIICVIICAVLFVMKFTKYELGIKMILLVVFGFACGILFSFVVPLVVVVTAIFLIVVALKLIKGKALVYFMYLYICVILLIMICEVAT